MPHAPSRRICEDCLVYLVMSPKKYEHGYAGQGRPNALGPKESPGLVSAMLL
jgi:hypothetical protein